jgi:hypothetical protein
MGTFFDLATDLQGYLAQLVDEILVRVKFGAHESLHRFQQQTIFVGFYETQIALHRV